MNNEVRLLPALKNNKTIVWNYTSGNIKYDGLSDRNISTMTRIEIREDVLQKWPVVKFSVGEDLLLSGLSVISGVGLRTLATLGKGSLRQDS